VSRAQVFARQTPPTTLPHFGITTHHVVRMCGSPLPYQLIGAAGSLSMTSDPVSRIKIQTGFMAFLTCWHQSASREKREKSTLSRYSFMRVPTVVTEDRCSHCRWQHTVVIFYSLTPANSGISARRNPNASDVACWPTIHHSYLGGSGRHSD
jgi:hypothetical protein